MSEPGSTRQARAKSASLSNLDAKLREFTVARVDAAAPLKQGERIWLAAKPGALHFFDIGTEVAVA